MNNLPPPDSAALFFIVERQADEEDIDFGILIGEKASATSVVMAVSIMQAASLTTVLTPPAAFATDDCCRCDCPRTAMLK
mmetsp:Transcript_21168/g.50316  ORF Transcript_21168/g.50316 Transcript_21168/m.50316 type:complete len:80 (-) Transcript_21168:81-320(-)